jgi:hypothetical protein
MFDLNYFNKLNTQTMIQVSFNMLLLHSADVRTESKLVFLW